MPTLTETDGRRDHFWEERGANPFFRFADEFDFNMGTWMAVSGMSEPKVNELIQYNASTLSFNNYTGLKELLTKVPYTVRTLLFFHFILLLLSLLFIYFQQHCPSFFVLEMG